MVEVPVGSVLVLYSDGMVEDRRTGLDPGLTDFIDAVGRLATQHPADPQPLAAAVMRAMAGPDRDDDMTLLVALHVGTPRAAAPEPATPQAAAAGLSSPDGEVFPADAEISACRSDLLRGSRPASAAEESWAPRTGPLPGVPSRPTGDRS